MVTLLYLLAFAQGLPPNPQAIPPSVHHMVLSTPRPLSERQAAERTAKELRNRLLKPLIGNRVGATPKERALIEALAKAARPEAFLYGNTAAWKALQDAHQKMRNGVSLSVLTAMGLHPYRPLPPPPPPVVETFRAGRPVKR
jgi:hypothetical protein